MKKLVKVEEVSGEGLIGLMDPSLDNHPHSRGFFLVQIKPKTQCQAV